MQKQKIALSVKNFTLEHEGNLLIQCEELEILSGSFSSIIGANGVGKTSLFKAILGLPGYGRGEIKILDCHPGSDVNKYVGYLPQKTHTVFPQHFTPLTLLQLAFEHWGWGFHLEGEAFYNNALNTLKMIDAEHLLHRPFNILSGGQQQKILLAQTLINKPKLLLLDEPLVNLDVESKKDFIQSLKKLISNKGITIIMISHDVHDLMSEIDYLIHIKNNRIHNCANQRCIKTDALL